MAESGAHYMLRRAMIIWKPEETIAETLAFCEETGVDEIIWKVDVEEFNHGFTSHELIREYIPWLERARDLQTEKEVLFSINPWVTCGHADRGHYPDGPPAGFNWRVSPEGETVTGIACPLSVGWRQWLLEAYRLYATTRPNKLWLEDDFRTFVWDIGPTAIGCFCQEHLSMFSKKIGEEIGREQLVERLLKPGEPDPVRAKWFDFQGEIMVRICRELEKVVHEESPSTRMGLMNSWSSDGRWWEKAALALAGSLRPLARPTLGPYEEQRATGYLPVKSDFLREIACLPGDTEICPELENYPYTAYSKSSRVTRLELALSQVFGCSSITMNLFDFVGSPTASEPNQARMLKETKPLLNAIAGLAGPCGKYRGVSVPFPKRYADYIHLRHDTGFSGLGFDGDGWCDSLQGSGIPVVLNGDGAVSAVTGQSVRALSPGEIEGLLSRGLLMDGSAAATLIDMGYGHLIGVETGSLIERAGIIEGAERDDWAEAPVYMSIRGMTTAGIYRLYPLTLSGGAEATSVLVDPDRRDSLPGMVVFENDLGGRVAVYPFDLSRGTNVGFMNWSRRLQLQRIVRWLGKGSVDLFVDGGAWTVPVRRDYSDYTLIAALNLDTDGWDGISITFNWPTEPEDLIIEHLESTGVLQRVHPLASGYDGWNVNMRLPISVPPLDVVVLRVRLPERD